MESINSDEPTANRVKTFYDKFSSRFIEDITLRNERITQQLRFLSEAIPAGVKSILIIGFGSGESAYYLATKVAPDAAITAIELSANSVRMAQAIFAHPRVNYRQLDIVKDS